jgi:hypothetical protein
MKLILTLSCIFILSGLCFGQKAVADLKPLHATALEQFLSKNKEYQFLSSNVIDAEYMKFIRESSGKTFEPYYQVGDFNQDKIADFAVILARKGKRKASGATSKEHKYDYPLAVVIFNGNKNGTFRKAFVENIEAPLVCFLSIKGTKKKTICFGVFETDSNTRIFKPVGKGYITKHSNAAY